MFLVKERPFFLFFCLKIPLDKTDKYGIVQTKLDTRLLHRTGVI